MSLSVLVDVLSSHVLLWNQPSRSAACKNERCPMPVTHVGNRGELLYAQAHHQAEVLSEAHLLVQPTGAPQEPRPATDGPKMIRETLCTAQSAVLGLRSEDPRMPEHVARLQRLIDEMDVQRPLGPDGKHGDRHTPTCGCEDAPATDSERDGRLRSAREYAAALRGRNAVPGSPSEAMVALDDEVTRLTALLAERDATIERRSQWTSETERAVREALSTIGVDGTYGGERVVRGVLATVGGLITEQAATAECARCENDLPVAWTDDEDQGYCETCVNAIMTDLHTELAEQAATIERVRAVHEHEVAYDDDVPEGEGEPVPADYEKHYCSEEVP